MRALPLAALLLLVSGCLSPGASPPAHGAQSSSASSSVPAPPAAAAPSPSGPAQRVATSAPFAMAGQTDTGVCAFGPLVGACRSAAGNGALRELEGAGPLLRLRGNLTWKGGLPMQVALLHLAGGNWTYTVGDPYASGSAPPLALDFDLRGRAGPLAIGVQQGNSVILPVAYAAVLTPQSFQLAGTLEWQP